MYNHLIPLLSFNFLIFLRKYSYCITARQVVVMVWQHQYPPPPKKNNLGDLLKVAISLNATAVLRKTA